MTDQGFLHAPVADPRIGTVVQDRYRIIRPLGEGGMGAVYEGEHIIIKRRVAIKCLHAQLASNPEIVVRFHNEALAATAIGHQNIVEVTDMGRFDDGAVFMVLEYLDGRVLSKAIEEDGPLPIGRVVRILSQACDALDAAHAKGIVHRDLKPENVFLIARGDNPDFVKVLDFGIAKFREGQSKGMTRTGTTMGTPYYMAPEQAQARKDVDHRADIYSLGIILFHALTRQHPFDDESYPMLVMKICSEPPPPLRSYRPDVPEELEAVMARMLAKDPADRYASCSEVKAALAPFRTLGGAPVVSEDAIPTNRIPARSEVRVADPPAETVRLGKIGKKGRAAEPGTLGPTFLPRRPRLPLVLAALTGLLGAGALAWTMARPDGTEEAVPPEVWETAAGSETVEEPRAEAPREEGTNEAAGAAGSAEAEDVAVRVQIGTEPPGAELFLDGDRIANPFDADLPQTSDPRRLEARLEGYRTVVQDLSLRFPQRVRIELERGGGVDDRRRRDRARNRRGQAASAAMATTTRTEEEAEGTEATTEQVSADGTSGSGESATGTETATDQGAAEREPAKLKRVRF